MPKPKLHFSLRVAQRILSHVNVAASLVKYERVTVLTFENRREQGYCLYVTIGDVEDWYKISFARDSSSDAIIVLVGSPGERFSPGNVPTERAYKNATRFHFGEERVAAAYINRIIAERAAALAKAAYGTNKL